MFEATFPKSNISNNLQSTVSQAHTRYQKPKLGANRIELPVNLQAFLFLAGFVFQASKPICHQLSQIVSGRSPFCLFIFFSQPWIDPVDILSKLRTNEPAGSGQLFRIAIKTFPNKQSEAAGVRSLACPEVTTERSVVGKLARQNHSLSVDFPSLVQNSEQSECWWWRWSFRKTFTFAWLRRGSAGV